MEANVECVHRVVRNVRKTMDDGFAPSGTVSFRAILPLNLHRKVPIGTESVLAYDLTRTDSTDSIE